MATPESSADHSLVHTDSVPLVDLRLLSQSELYSLSLCSASASASSSASHLHRRFDEPSIIPKIDRSVFNESAGSRKQTFSRLRLAPRNKQISPVSASSATHIPLHNPADPLDEENSQIIALLQQLFGVESFRNAKREDDDCLVPVQVEFKDLLPESAATAFQNIPIDVVDGVGMRKRKRGRPRKNGNAGIPVEGEPEKVGGEGEAEALTVVNEKGVVVDAVALANAGDPFVEELKRRTRGLETESQLLEFLERLNGEWGSQRKKRRFVQASDLGDLLPRGWKIVLSLQRRAGRASIVCGRYVSPDGHQFVSWKEVSMYLLSLFGVQDISRLKSSYTDGSLRFSSNINLASDSGVGHVPTVDMKADGTVSCLYLAGTSVRTDHEKLATASSSIESEKLNTCDGNFNSGLALGRVHNVRKEKLVDAIEATDAAWNLDIPLVVSTSFSNNNSGFCQFSDVKNAFKCIKSGISNFASHDGNTGCYETVPCGNEQAHVDNNGHWLSVRLVEDPQQKIGFERSMLAPNSEGKNFSGNSAENRHPISSLEDMEISDGKPIEGDKRQIISTSDQSKIKDVSTNAKLQSNSEGCSLVLSQNDLKHMSINCTNRRLTSMLKDPAEGKCFDSDLSTPSIDERTCVASGYINNVSFSTSKQDASESGGVDIAPNLKVEKDVSDNRVASNLKVAKDVSDNHGPPNEDIVMSCGQENSSLNDQICKIDNLLHRSSERHLLSPANIEYPSAFDENVSKVSARMFDSHKAVEAGCKKPQLDIVSSSSDTVVESCTTTSTMQGRSQGCISVALSGSILNQFDKQSLDDVNNGNKSCLSEKAKTEQGEIFQTDSSSVPEFC